MDTKTVILWALGSLSSILIGVGSWIFRRIFKKLETLEEDHNSHKQVVNEKFSLIEKELALNAERDTNNYESIMSTLHTLHKAQEKMFVEIEKVKDEIISLKINEAKRDA